MDFYFDERLEKPLQEYSEVKFITGDTIIITRMLDGIASVVRKMRIECISKLGNPVYFQLD